MQVDDSSLAPAVHRRFESASGWATGRARRAKTIFQ